MNNPARNPSILKVRNYLPRTSSVAVELVPYTQAWHSMREFTRGRDHSTSDELWFMEHSPVFTLGQAGDFSHILDAHKIPVIKVDRGGQVTYHGPGQVMMYVLFDLARLGVGVRTLVEQLENTVVTVLAAYGICAQGRRDAPGVYIDDKKIAALGLRVSKGRCYHGLSLNVMLDLAPFSYINPCGYPDMEVTQLSDNVSELPDKETIIHQLTSELADRVGYRDMHVGREVWAQSSSGLTAPKFC